MDSSVRTRRPRGEASHNPRKESVIGWDVKSDEIWGTQDERAERVMTRRNEVDKRTLGIVMGDQVLRQNHFYEDVFRPASLGERADCITTR